MRILVTGLDQSNFLQQLYASIKGHKKDIYIGITSLRHLGKQQNGDYNNTFDKIYNNQQTPPFLAMVYAFVKLLFSRWFINIFLYILLVEGKFKKALHFCYVTIKEKAFYKHNGNFASYDVFHFHYIQYSYIRGIWMVPPGKKIICSFWGSDLLRTSDSFNHYLVKKALQKATVITVQSKELMEVVLIKYGASLRNKIQVVQFSLDQTLFTNIDKLRADEVAKQDFCIRNSISTTLRRIVVGHNASNFNNHVAIINQVSKIAFKHKLFVIVPFAYGIAPETKDAYKKQLEEALAATGTPFVILDAFLEDEKLALLRLVSDIMVHMPETDALSAALTETAYAGNVIVTGNWLPYSPFRQAGMQVEFTDFDNLANVLDEVIGNYKNIQPAIGLNNQAAVREYFFPAKTAMGWLHIFDDLNKPDETGKP